MSKTKKTICPECDSKLLIGFTDDNEVDVIKSQQNPKLKEVLDNLKTSTSNKDVEDVGSSDVKDSKLKKWFTSEEEDWDKE